MPSHRSRHVFRLLLALAAAPALVADPLPRTAPEEQGVFSERILSFVEHAADKLDSLHSVMILRHGSVIAEGWWAPYEARAPHELYSLSKSFTSTAIGFAVSEGKLSIDDPVAKFFPAEMPDRPSANLEAMRVRDLLSMSAGHEKEISAAKDKVSAKAFLSHPVPFEPGTHFLYNTPATFMLSAIVQKIAGGTVLEYLKPRLFEPLGIAASTWETNFQGISLGGYGLSVTTEDIARFGQLYLQNGRWNGRQILPESWVKLATARQISNGSDPRNDWAQGYGFQFWRCRNGAYRGDGAFGQYCLVLPEQRVVIAITSGLRDMQAVLNLVWGDLLPAFAQDRLPNNDAAHERLKARLASLTLRGVRGSVANPASAQVRGRTYALEPNAQGLQTVTLNESELVLEGTDSVQRIAFSPAKWIPGRAALAAFPERPIAATGAWTADDTFQLKICLTETPYVLAFTLKFDRDKIILDREFNVFFGPAKLPRLTGVAR